MTQKRLLFILCIAVCMLLLTLSACNRNSEKNVVSPIYEINVTYDGEYKIHATENVCYFNNSDTTLTQITMALYANAYNEGNQPFSKDVAGSAYYNGLSYGGITVSDLKIDKSPAEYTVDGTTLNFNIPQLESGKSINLSLEYEITLPECTGRLGKTPLSVNLCNFYPQICPIKNGKFVTHDYSCYGDPFCSEIADFYVNVTLLDADTKIATGGSITDVYKDESGKTTYEIISEKTRDFGLVFSKSFKTTTKNCNGINITYQYLSDEAPEDTVNLAANALTSFSKAFGKYPYSSFTICETPFAHRGMEYSSLILITDKMLAKERELTVIHETAHQWWYGVVGSDQYEEAYLDEGLTEFSTAYYYHLQGNDETFSNLIAAHKANYQTYSEYLSSKGIPFDCVMTKALNEFSSQSEYIITAYDKGALAINSLYEIMGEKKFNKAMQLYFSENAYKIADVSCLKKAVNKYSKQAGKTVDPWLDGTVKL